MVRNNQATCGCGVRTGQLFAALTMAVAAAAGAARADIIDSGGTVSKGGIQQIYANPAAPFINSLVTPGNADSVNVSYASDYTNVLATAGGNNASIHPSEPNYLWQESGTNFGIANDNDPYGSGNNVAAIQTYLAANPTVSGQNLSNLLQMAGISWKSYQEDTDLETTNGITDLNGSQAAYDGKLTTNGLTSTAVAPTNYTVPLSSFSGTSANYTNPYNGSHQYNFAAKHDGSLYYTSTNGGNNATTSNPLSANYAPLQKLTNDLATNTVARYNLITPDQYNDMHTGLSGGFNYNGVHFTGDAAQIAQGDNFLSIIVPQIEASQAYKNNGVIVIWMDETEGDSTGGSQNDLNHTLMEIVLSPLAKGGAFKETAQMTHSSDVKWLQEVFGVTSGGFLNDAAKAGTPDLSDLFKPGALAQVGDVFVIDMENHNWAQPDGNVDSLAQAAPVPEPAAVGLLGLGGLALLSRRRRLARKA